MRPKAEALGYLICGKTRKEGFDGISAGEDEPVVAREVGECGVESGKGGGWSNLDGGDEDGFETGGAEGFGEGRGLVRGAGDENSW